MKRCLGSGRSVSSPLVPSFFPSLRPTPFDSLGLPPSLFPLYLTRSLSSSVPPSPPRRRRPRKAAASPRAKISVVCAVSSDSIGHPESVVRRQRPATTPASSKSPLRHSFPSWSILPLGPILALLESTRIWCRICRLNKVFNEILNPIAGLNKVVSLA